MHVQVRQSTVQPRRPDSYSRHSSSSGRSLSPSGPRQSLATPNPQGLHPEQRAGGRRWSAARQGRTRIARRRQAWCAALGCGGSHGRAAVAQGPDSVTGSQSQPMTQFERNRTGQAGPSGTAGLALSTSRLSNRFDSEQLATVQFRTSSVSQVRATVTLERYLPHCHAARAEHSTLVGKKESLERSGMLHIPPFFRHPPTHRSKHGTTSCKDISAYSKVLQLCSGGHWGQTRSGVLPRREQASTVSETRIELRCTTYTDASTLRRLHTASAS